MRSWVISVPVWGRKYVDTFVNYAVPSLRVALRRFTEPHRFIIHTDDPGRIRAALSGFQVETLPVGRKTTYVTLQESHADAMARTKIGEAIVLLNGDLVISRNLFKRCAEHFDSGPRALVMVGIRTNLNDAPPPVGQTPRKLLNWAWDHRHQIIKDLEWGLGASLLPTNLFFSTSDKANVVMRGFHLHPIAVLKEKPIPFQSTIDGDLLNYFHKSEIHVVCDPDDMSMLEMSEAGRRFPVSGRQLSPAGVAASMSSRANRMHKWLFTHRIIIKGTGDGCNDTPVAQEVLHRLGYNL